MWLNFFFCSIGQCALLLVLSFCGKATANELLIQETNFIVGMSGWISSGETDWNHDASSSSIYLGNPSSKLSYEDVDSNIIEFSVEAIIASDYFIRGNLGFGGIDDGTLIDDDFLTTSTTGDFLASRSFSDIGDDGIWFLNFDVGYTLWTEPANQNSRIKVFAGYQHWEEDYNATGLTYDVCTVGGALLGICSPAGTSFFPGESVISNKVEWDSLRLGVEAEKKFGKSFSVEVSAIFIPYSDMHNEDIHHLRTDLAQPGFVMNGTGMGYNLEFTASYEVISNLLLSAGYKYWSLESDGDIEVRGMSASRVFPLNDLNSVRKGVTIGLSYKF